MSTHEEETQQIANGLIQNERLIAELYGLFAEKLPDLVYFWTHLHHDELDHASWIEYFQKEFAKGNEHVFFNTERFSIGAINTFGAYLKDLIEKAKTKPTTAIEALSTAFDVEKALLERRILEVFEADKPELKNLLYRLSDSTERHFLAVEREWYREIRTHRAG